MSDTASLSYTKEHEWLRVDGDLVTVGITHYAAAQLGDVVFVELPALGREVRAGEVVGEIESTKSVGELFAPVGGTVIERNESVVDAPEAVNADPYGAGWLLTIRADGVTGDLLSESEYLASIGQA